MTSYEVLNYLYEAPAGRMRMCDLAEQAQLSRSGLTRLVDRLERDGLLSRCSCDHDARGAYACVTDAGRERLDDARVTHLAVVRQQFFSHFNEAELDLLADMWERIAPLHRPPRGLTLPPAQRRSHLPAHPGGAPPRGGPCRRLQRVPADHADDRDQEGDQAP